jgi:hypothetical protein
MTQKDWSFVVVVVFLVLVAAIGEYSYFFEYAPKYHAQTLKQSQLTSLLAKPPEVLQLKSQTKLADCQIQGPLPDQSCTPGAVFANATQEIVCVPGYTKTVRSVSTNTRKKVFAEYGISYPQPYGSYEVDHLIPLVLGGSNDIANLFPEAADPYPGFKEKDVVEDFLYQQVCAGHVALSVAQQQIADNWLVIYSNLSPETIATLKKEFKSWASRSSSP